MTQKLKKDIMQCCNEINQKCEIQFQQFNFEHLRSREWYLTILGILFPHLEEKIGQLNQLDNERQAIDNIIILVNELDQFQNLEIDGSKVVDGDVDEIATMVQVILTLLEITLDEYESGTDHPPEIPQNKQKNMVVIEESGQKRSKDKKSLSDYNKPKSVQGIGNQFEKLEEEEEDQHQDHLIFKNMQLKQMNNNNGIEKQNKEIGEKQGEKDKNQQQLTVQKGKKQTNREKINNSTQQISSQKKKQKTKKQKNLQQTLAKPKKPKKTLITHPKIPQTLKKIKSTQQLQLTKKVEQDIKKTKKKIKKYLTPDRYFSVSHQQMKRKNKLHELLVKEQQHNKKQVQAAKNRKKDLSVKNKNNFMKILNWRDDQLKRQKRDYQQSIKLKLETHKQNYIKKINKLIFDLEKQKQIQDKKDFKQTLVKDNEDAIKRLTALEEWYKNKLNMIKQNRQQKKQERMLIKTGHKEIIGQIEKYLKKENEEKLVKLTQKMRTEHNRIETDFQQLKDKIIKVYKRN